MKSKRNKVNERKEEREKEIVWRLSPCPLRAAVPPVVFSPSKSPAAFRSAVPWLLMRRRLDLLAFVEGGG